MMDQAGKPLSIRNKKRTCFGKPEHHRAIIHPGDVFFLHRCIKMLTGEGAGAGKPATPFFGSRDVLTHIHAALPTPGAEVLFIHGFARDALVAFITMVCR